MNSKPARAVFHRLMAPVGAMATALLAGCLGPWNVDVNNGQAPVRLEVSCMLVAGRPFDSLWLERPLSFQSAYDSSVSFVDTTRSFLQVIRLDAPGDTVIYHPDPYNTRLWRPDRLDTVRIGARYAFRARVRWNASVDFPVNAEWREDTLAAETYVQRLYAINNTASVPIEALHPALSLGLPSGRISLALQDTVSSLNALYDSLNSVKSLSTLNVSVTDFLRYLRGYPVFRPLHKNDTAYYIFDPSSAKDFHTGNSGGIHRYARQWSFLQSFSPLDFGGLLLVGGHDIVNGTRILDPLTKQIHQSLNLKPDSADLYQTGNTRLSQVHAGTIMGVPGYPDTLPFSNLNIDYAGKDVFYFYAVDSLYIHYLAGINSNQGGEDDGGGNAGNAHPYSNVRGGWGYFTAAVLDSFPVQVIALQDTYSVAALHQAWLNNRSKNGP